MKKPNPAYVERMNQIANSSPFFSLLSMKIQDIGVGYSKIEIDLDKKHLHPFGLVHGGVFASIIDAATFWACYYDVEDQNATATTVDLKLNFLAPASTGKLIANGRRIKQGKTLGYAEAEVTDHNGTLLAHGTSTLMILQGRAIKIDPPLPPKFII